MYHHLRLSWVSGLGGRFVLVLGVVTHLNILVTASSLILIQFVIVIVTLFLQILTLSIGVFFIILASGLLPTSHLLVFALGLTLALLIGVLKFLQKGSFKLSFLLTVGVAVIIQAISLGLVRWVLGGGGLLRIPEGSLANIQKIGR